MLRAQSLGIGSAAPKRLWTSSEFSDAHSSFRSADHPTETLSLSDSLVPGPAECLRRGPLNSLSTDNRPQDFRIARLFGSHRQQIAIQQGEVRLLPRSDRPD